MTKIRFAVIGYGHIGRRHADLIQAHPEAELVAVCDILPREQLDLSPAELTGTAFFRAMDGLLAEMEFDVACICTPNGLHAPQAQRCLEAGRHVVIEKPIALSVADCDALIETAGRTGLHVFGVMQNRYSPASAWLKERVTEGSLGEILQVHVDCFWNRDHRYYTTPDGTAHPWHGSRDLDGGVLFTQFAHFLDLLCWTFGELRVLNAIAVNQAHGELHEFADSGMVHLLLRSGAMGSLNYSTVVWDTNFESTLSVIGSRGTVKLGGQYMNDLRYCRVDGLEVPTLPSSAPPNNYGPYQGSAANHHFVIDNVIDVLKGRGEVATTAAEGREVVRLIEEIHRASKPA